MFLQNVGLNFHHERPKQPWHTLWKQFGLEEGKWDKDFICQKMEIYASLAKFEYELKDSSILLAVFHPPMSSFERFSEKCVLRFGFSIGNHFDWNWQEPRSRSINFHKQIICFSELPTITVPSRTKPTVSNSPNIIQWQTVEYRFLHCYLDGWN